MKFNNRPNVCTSTNGGDVWVSRSVAVTAVVVAHEEDECYALIQQRGHAVDNSGEWCLVCGYLDWDESAYGAIERELFEEAGIDVRTLQADGTCVVGRVPVFISSDPSGNRQNVSMRFPVELTKRVEVSNLNAEPGEVLQLKWIPVNHQSIGEFSFVFNHDIILLQLAEWHREEKILGIFDKSSTRRFYQSQIKSHYPFV
jgi:8-oxo-dGTP pyrophosphatase MutT (NUDIX family)